MINEDCTQTVVPTRLVGPLYINYNGKLEEVIVPLATYESPLWNSVDRGARVSKICNGINVAVSQNIMTRSIIVECKNLYESNECVNFVISNKSEISSVVKSTSRFAELMDISGETVGTLVFFRISIISGEASGHNMVTKASQAIILWIIENFKCEYVSISGNFCCDKKVSAVNGILGRGKRVSAEIVISKEVCEKILRTTPEKMHNLNTKKNLIGSCLAGSVRSSNAHYANMLLAVYIATGQDAANIVEGSQGITYTNLIGDSLYFSVNLPNLIVGTIGNGKELDFANRNLELMGCFSQNGGSERLAALIGCVVLCGELSLLAAITNNGELVKSHIALERNQK